LLAIPTKNVVTLDALYNAVDSISRLMYDCVQCASERAFLCLHQHHAMMTLCIHSGSKTALFSERLKSLWLII